MVWTWSLKTEYIPPENVIQPVQMLCWAAKWLGEPDVEFRSLRHDGRRRMVKRMWKLLDSADSVIHYNGSRFDIPHLNREFLELGLLPPAPYAQIDLLKTARRQFRFDSNRLDRVARQVGIGKKEEHEGFRLWLRCMDGEASAWERMKRYNVQDVRLTEQLYERLRPWIPTHPSIGAHQGGDVCPRCGSSRLEHRGFAVLRTGRYRRLHCTKCGGWSRETHRFDATAVTEIAA